MRKPKPAATPIVIPEDLKLFTQSKIFRKIRRQTIKMPAAVISHLANECDRIAHVPLIAWPEQLSLFAEATDKYNSSTKPRYVISAWSSNGYQLLYHMVSIPVLHLKGAAITVITSVYSKGDKVYSRNCLWSLYTDEGVTVNNSNEINEAISKAINDKDNTYFDIFREVILSFDKNSISH